jgi:toxin ParE1/3/4
MPPPRWWPVGDYKRDPKLGRVRLDLAPERYRFWSLRGFPYLLVYDAEAEPPIILRFVHQSRDLPALLDL